MTGSGKALSSYWSASVPAPAAQPLREPVVRTEVTVAAMIIGDDISQRPSPWAANGPAVHPLAAVEIDR